MQAAGERWPEVRFPQVASRSPHQMKKIMKDVTKEEKRGDAPRAARQRNFPRRFARRSLGRKHGIRKVDRATHVARGAGRMMIVPLWDRPKDEEKKEKKKRPHYGVLGSVLFQRSVQSDLALEGEKSSSDCGITHELQGPPPKQRGKRTGFRLGMRAIHQKARAITSKKAAGLGGGRGRSYNVSRWISEDC